MKLLILSLLFLTACAKNTCQGIDPSLQSYYDTFVAEGLKRGIDVRGTNVCLYREAKPGPSGEYGGWCDYESHKATIKDSTFLALHLNDSSNILEETIFHELGHCVLGIHYHTPGEIMDANQLPGYTAADRDKYLDDLFYNHR